MSIKIYSSNNKIAGEMWTSKDYSDSNTLARTIAQTAMEEQCSLSLETRAARRLACLVLPLQHMHIVYFLPGAGLTGGVLGRAFEATDINQETTKTSQNKKHIK